MNEPVIGNAAKSAGTKHPICDSIKQIAICFIYVVFPLEFTPARKSWLFVHLYSHQKHK